MCYALVFLDTIQHIRLDSIIYQCDLLTKARQYINARAHTLYKDWELAFHNISLFKQTGVQKNVYPSLNEMSIQISWSCSL